MATITDHGDGTSEVVFEFEGSDQPDAEIQNFLDRLPAAVVGSTAPGIYFQNVAETDASLTYLSNEGYLSNYNQLRRIARFVINSPDLGGTYFGHAYVTQQAADFIKRVFMPYPVLPAAPTIISFDPISGPVGTRVTVHGSGFSALALYAPGAGGSLSLDAYGVSDDPSFGRALVLDDGTITFSIVDGMTSGQIQVVNATGDSVISDDTFTVT